MIRYSKTDNSMRNIVWGMINKGLVVIWPFIIRYLMIQKIGVEYLGLSSLFASILQMMSLAELGFGSAMVYAMYKPIADGNTREINALLSFYRFVYRGIGVIILVVGLILIPFLHNFVNGTCPEDINLYILYGIYLANTVCSYWLFAYKNSILTAYHRVDVTSKITGVVNVCVYILQCLVLLLFGNYYIYTIIIPLGTVVCNLCTEIMTRKMFPEVKCIGTISISTKREIRKRVVALLGHKLGAVVTNSTDNLVISSFLGLTMLAIYNNYYQIMASLIGIFSIVNNSLLAGLGNSIVTDSIKKNYGILESLTFANVWIIGWCSTCLLCLYQPFISLWIGDRYLFDFEVVILFSIYFYIWKFKDMLAVYKDAAGMWWDDRWKPIVYCIVNIVLSIGLVKTIGIAGVIIGTIVSQIFVAIPWETVVFFRGYVYKDASLKGALSNYIVTLLKYTIVILLAAIISYLCCNLVNMQSPLIILVYRGVICLIVPNLIYWGIFHKTKEYHFFYSRINDIFFKKLSG